MTVPTPRARQRQNAYTDIGVQGRKTGVTLRDLGRDENGLELVDGMFSSPEKAVTRSIKSRSGATNTASEDMDIDDASGPEPREILTGRSIRLPPRSRSPIKGAANSSPMRPRFSSVALQSSPSKRPPAPIPNFRRSQGQRQSLFMHDSSPPLPGIEDPFGESSKKSAHQRAHDRLSQSPARPPKSNGLRAPSVRVDPSPAAQRTTGQGLNKRKRGGGLMSQIGSRLSAAAPFRLAEEEVFSITEDTVPDVGEDSQPLLNGDVSLAQMEDESVDDRTPSPQASRASAVAKAAPKNQGRKPTQAVGGKKKPTVATTKGKGKATRGRPPKVTAPVAQSPVAVDQESQPSSLEDETEVAMSQEAEEPPRKKTRTTNKPVPEPKATRQTSSKPGPSSQPQPKKPKATQAKPSTKMDPPPKPKATTRTASADPPTPSKAGSSTHILLRRHEASQEPEARATRSGRNVIKPLAFWKGECVEYADRRQSKGGSFVQGGIREVVRADEIVEERKVGSKVKKTKKTGKKKGLKREAEEDDGSEEEEESEDEAEDWETTLGYVNGEVVVWDDEAGDLMVDAEGYTIVEPPKPIAYAGDAIETKAVANCDFTMTKTLSLPFFGAGLVDLPPGAVKHLKDPGVMQLVFFVASGRVTVSVNGTMFGIGKGGIFEVPRGNVYGIENSRDKPARLFFAQGSDLTAAQREDMKIKQAEAEAEKERRAAAAEQTEESGFQGDSAVNGTFASEEEAR